MRRIGIFAYEGVNALDVTGPAEVFAAANDHIGHRAYEIVLVCAGDKPVRSESGVMIGPSDDVTGPFDTIIVAGGRGLREERIGQAAIDWIRAQSRSARRVVSVCTGLYALAATGLLDGRRATSHWRFCADLKRRFPSVGIEADPVFIKDGAYYSSAGITAGIDLCLALVEEDLGPSAALAVARELVVFLKRPGGQLQYSEPLSFQTRSSPRFADLAAWLPANLCGDLSIEALAARANLGRRHFARAFKSAFGVPPSDYVESLRLTEAQRRLPLPGQTIGSVAASVGYASADAFRHAFERRFGVSPSTYRERFCPIQTERNY